MRRQSHCRAPGRRGRGSHRDEVPGTLHRNQRKQQTALRNRKGRYEILQHRDRSDHPADLPDADTTKMGLKGSPTKVKATFTPKRTANCVNIEGVSPVEIADNLIGKLVEAKVL